MSKAMRRRVGYSLSYEGIAILCSTLLLTLFGSDVVRAIPLSITTSVIALIWNVIWNTFFEFLEKRFSWKGRSVPVRIAHAIGFEGGLGLICIPIMAWWLGFTLLEAFFAEAALLAFFLMYTYVFNYLFDKIFGLPESARPDKNEEALTETSK